MKIYGDKKMSWGNWKIRSVMGKKLSVFVLLVCLMIGLWPVRRVEALEQVGALVDQVSTGTLVTIVGKHAPRSQIVVVSGDDVVAGALDRGSGEFEFSFRVDDDQLSDLRVFGSDPAAKTNDVRVPAGGLAQVLLPPTLVLDPDFPESEDSVGVGGYTYPGSIVTLYLSDNVGETQVFQVQAGGDGDWEYVFLGLVEGEYDLVATSQSGTLQSVQSQVLRIVVELPEGAAEDVGDQVSRVVRRVGEVVLPPGISEVVDVVAPQASFVSESVAPVVSAGLLAQLTLLVRDIAYFLMQMVIAAMQYFGLWRKRRPWGVVYDAITKQPMMLATVRLYQVVTTGEGQTKKEMQKLVETDVTSKQGIFSFIPEAGVYVVKAAKAGYTFPSKLVRAREDGEYAHVYHGEKIQFAGEKQAVEVSVPIDPVDAKVNWRFRVARFIRSRIYWFTMTTLAIGWLMALVAVLGGQAGINGFFLLFYTLMLALQVWVAYSRRRTWGRVEGTNGQSLQGVQLDLMDPKFERLVQRRVTDDQGRYQFIVPEGEYDIRVSSTGQKLVTDNKKYYQGQRIVVTGTRPRVIRVKIMVTSV